MKKLMLLILLMVMSLKGFSQKDTNNTSIQLQKPIARLVIKDLIKGDGLGEELLLKDSKITLLKQKIVLKDSVISNLNTQILNFSNILDNKNTQSKISKQLSDRLNADLKKQQLKTKLMSGAGLIAVLGVLVLAK